MTDELTPQDIHFIRLLRGALDNSPDVIAMRQEIAKLSATVDTLRDLQPAWVQYGDSDSITRYHQANAIATLWKMLGATNQSEAVTRLRSLIACTRKINGPSAYPNDEVGEAHTTLRRLLADLPA